MPFFKKKTPPPADSVLLIGLGNPGAKYDNNRHNLGFMALEAIAKELNVTSWEDKFGGLLARVDNLYLFKPQSFMNNSGVPVSKLANFYKIPLARIFVFYDELDLVLTKIKIKQGGGDGGHNGIRSLDAHLGKDYWRVRLGINHPGHKDLVHNHVLSDFTAEEHQQVNRTLAILSKNIKHLMSGDTNLFLTRYAEALTESTK